MKKYEADIKKGLYDDFLVKKCGVEKWYSDLSDI